MQIANCKLILNEFKASVPKRDITPTEAQLLIHLHGENAGGLPLANLTIKNKKDVPTLTATSNEEQKILHAKAIGRNTKVEEASKRTDQAERKRLAEHYKPFSTDPKAITIEKVFPKGTKLPQTFEEVVDKEGGAVFRKDGSTIDSAKPAEVKVEVVQKIKVGDKEYTAEELAKLIPAKQA